MFSSAITGPDGSFELHGIEDGRHSIVAYAREHVPRVLSGIEVEGRDIGPIILELAAGDAGGGAFDIVGIGVQVSASQADLRIVHAIPGGSADRAGIQAGDRIIAVDGLPVSDYDFSGAVEALRGIEGTVVSLTVSRAGEVFDVEAIRARVRG